MKRIKLRPYQERAVKEIVRADACVRLLLVAPTAAGKSVIIANASVTFRAMGQEVLILSHRKEIVDQIREHLDRAGLNEQINVY